MMASRQDNILTISVIQSAVQGCDDSLISVRLWESRFPQMGRRGGSLHGWSE
jgi:hypothetical protein